MYRLATVVASLTLAAAGVSSDSVSARPIDYYCSQVDALGVSRTQVIDTTGGPRFGRQFEPAGTSFLQPGEVVLTFDDGPYAPTTGAILDTLDRFCAKATFFAVGRIAIAQPETLRSVVRRGHTLGGHTWAHANLNTLGDQRRAAEVEKGFSALSEIAGARVAPFFRFPYLAQPESELKRLSERNVAVFGIDVDSTDSHGQHVSASRIVSRTLDQLEKTGKGIILMHDLKPNTAAALPVLLAALKEKGYRLVHIVPAAAFEPNTAYSAEVADIVARRGKPAEVANVTTTRPRRIEASVVVRAPRNLGKRRKAHQRTTQGSTKPRKEKPPKRSRFEARSGRFQHI